MDTIPEPFSLRNPLVSPESARRGFRVPFGLRDGRVWAPSEVARGKACDCVCPGCLAPLAAKAQTSRRKRPHFAHLAQTDCHTGCETGIHLRAKQIIEDRRELLLPAWIGDLLEMPNPPQARDDGGQLHEGRIVEMPASRVALLKVQPECWLGSYKPDIYALDATGELLIEIRVTHAVDDKKAERVQARAHRMIEIDLSALDRSLPLDPDGFEHAVLFEYTNRTWISCPQAVEDWRASKDTLDRQVAERNRWLADQDKLAAQAAWKRQERAATEAKDKASRREHMRQLERIKHANDLALLKELTEPSRVARVLREYQMGAEARVSELLELATPAVRSACLSAHPDSWIFGVDPGLWQLLAYDQFIGKRQPGDRFNQRDVATWVRTRFPYEKPLYRLFITQYVKRLEARQAGFGKRRLAYWAFTQEENTLIPNFYAPINTFMERLAYAQIIRHLPSPIGECEVLSPPQSGFNPIAGIHANSRGKSLL